MNFSYWEQESYFSNIDIVIIGSGIVGLSAALHLRKKNKKLKILIVERGIIPSGASTKNAGFACFGSISELIADLKTHSENEVFSLVEKRWKGLQKLRKSIGDKNLDFHQWGGFELFNNSAKFHECSEQMNYFNKQIGAIVKQKVIYKKVDSKIKQFGFNNVKHLITNTAEGQINTGMLMSNLFKKAVENDIKILNGFEIVEINDNEGTCVEIKTMHNILIKCKKVIIATNGFAKQFLNNEDIQPARAQVLITEPINNLKLKGTFHYDEGFYYFRNINNRILLGGGRNIDLKGETTTIMDITDPIQNKLEDLLYNTIIPYTKPKIELRWSGIMGMGNKKEVIIKSISKNVFCGVRLGGMGIAIGTVVGEEVANLCLDD